MKIPMIGAFFLVFVTLCAGPAWGGSVLIRQGKYSYGYNGANSTDLTHTMNAILGSRITVVSNFSNAAQVQGSSALWIDLGDQDERLSATEIANIEAFESTGRRVVMWGERADNFWGSWDQDLLATVGSSVSTPYLFTVPTLTTQFASPLTQNVSTITMAGAATPVGGTALFDQNIETLWGTSKNVLTILDTNTINSVRDFNGIIPYQQADNAVFVTNVVNWVAATPEPSTFVLGGLGLSGLLVCAVRRRRVT